MESLWLAALEKAGPWAIVVLLLYVLWDMSKRNDNGTRSAIKDQIAALQAVVTTLGNTNQALAAIMVCLQSHDKRVEGIEETVKFNGMALERANDEIKELRGLALKIDESLRRERP